LIWAFFLYKKLTDLTISLEKISLLDFLGVEDQNTRELASAFPRARISSRGDVIHVKGNDEDLIKIQEVIGLMKEIYSNKGKVTRDDIKLILQIDSNISEYQIDDSDSEIIVHGNRGLVIRAKTQNQKNILKAIRTNDVVFAVGPAGTGKTYTAVALAVRALKNKEVKKIIFTRPAVEAGENLGFLPGDLKEKIDPYLRPIYDALEDMIPLEKLKFLQETKVIEIAPLAYMRGRTLNNAFIILDEAQNTTSMQIKMFLTRMGPSSKVIITGDKTQVDLPKKVKSGLLNAIEILKDIQGISFVELDGKDVLRHRIVKDILAAYEKHDELANYSVKTAIE